MKTPSSRPTRRSFLASSLAAGAALPLTASLSGASAAPRHGEPKKILVLGGTVFLGPPFVRAAIANGHTVTLFNRGKSNPELFPDLEQLQGDRDTGDLASLQGRQFDVIVDNSGYVPAHVEATAKLFAEHCKLYQFISTISVYGGYGDRAEAVDEDAEVAEVSDEEAAKVTTIREVRSLYGALKARCEKVAEAVLPGRVCTIRPGLIVGPGDTSDRFTWWPHRIAQGGEVLAPGDRDGRVQFIDVRDLAAFMLHCIEQHTTGIYNANGFAGPVSMQEVLDGCKCATSEPVTLTWASEQFLADNQVGAWMQMPLWLPRSSRSISVNTRAQAAGLSFRPIADTIRDTLQWCRTERGDKAWRTGVPAERERELLLKWHQHVADSEKPGQGR